jgi:hypothetical protein
MGRCSGLNRATGELEGWEVESLVVAVDVPAFEVDECDVRRGLAGVEVNDSEARRFEDWRIS